MGVTPSMLAGIAYLCTILFSICLYSAFTVLIFANKTFPESQYKSVMSKIKSVNTHTVKKYRDKDLEAIRREELAEKNYVNVASRMGISMSYKEYKRQGITGILMGVLGFIFGVIALVAIRATLPKNIFSTSFSVVIFLIIFGFLTYIGNKTRFRIKMDKRALKKDILNEISMLISIFKNSAENVTFYEIVENFLPSANALKVDLSLLLEDVNVYQMNGALTRFAERINLPIVDRFSLIAKSLQSATVAQRIAPLTELEKEAQKDLNEVMVKEHKRNINVMIIIIAITFIATMLAAFTPTLSEVKEALTFTM